jgi:endonuclease III-like uncharacterized protein
VFTAAFEMILFACQQERLYQLYLKLIAKAYELQQAEGDKLSDGDYEEGCSIKPEFVSLLIRKKTSHEHLWSLMVSIQHENITGKVLVQSTSEKVVASFMDALGNEVEQNIFLKISQRQENPAI